MGGKRDPAEVEESRKRGRESENEESDSKSEYHMRT